MNCDVFVTADAAEGSIVQNQLLADHVSIKLEFVMPSSDPLGSLSSNTIESRACSVSDSVSSGSEARASRIVQSTRCDGGLVDPSLPTPNFFVVGAAKAGTTSIHAYLSGHPQVFMSALKEPHYFASFEVSPEFDNFKPVIRDRADYHDLFHGSEEFLAIGEASPSYLCDPEASARIRSVIPHAKIIISLRNPVDRAFSAYLELFYEGKERRLFDEAVNFDLSRADKGWGRSAGYVELGLYASQVESYLKVFGREQVLVILFEDLVRNTGDVMQKIARFLGIDPARFPDSAFAKVHNPFEMTRGPIARAILRSRPIRVWAKRIFPQGARTTFRDRFLFVKGRKPRLEDESRRALAALFAADVERLERLLGRDLGILKTSAVIHSPAKLSTDIER